MRDLTAMGSNGDKDLGASLTSVDWLHRLNVGGNDGDGKPPYSYANLISLAINSTAEKKMTLADIYKWIQESFPYYQKAGNGWKNSIRHNLSLNKAFDKVSRDEADPGKGSYWIVVDNPEKGSSRPKRSKKKKKDLKETAAPYPPARSRTSSTQSAKSASSPLSPNKSSLMDLPDFKFPEPFKMTSTLGSLGGSTDLSSSFKILYQSVVNSAQQQQQLPEQPGVPPISLETMESLLDEVQQDANLRQSLNSTQLQNTKNMLSTVKAEAATLGGSWQSAQHYPGLAQSFNQLLFSSGIGLPSMGSMNNGFKKSSASSLGAKLPDEVEEEEPFDWDSIV